MEHAGDAKAALALVQASAPPVVLLDVNLPDASGFELCRQLRALPGAAQPSVIFVSARASDIDQVQGLAVGADDFVTKPFSLAVLVAKVRRALERRTASLSAGAPGTAATAGADGAPPDYDDSRLRVEFSTGRQVIRPLVFPLALLASGGRDAGASYLVFPFLSELLHTQTGLT
ncbi:MAG: response regulator transcription factor [Buchananella hordeovulneris]|nr:response regulator transcription factor [Buchananella hordeovulneris]